MAITHATTTTELAGDLVGATEWDEAHDGTNDHNHSATGSGAKLAQANTHESPDTDSGTSSLHHTIGTGATQAAAGNHSHGASTVGAELDYVEVTTLVSITATAEGSANTVVTGSAVAYDGSTAIVIEFFAPRCLPTGTAGAYQEIYLYDGSSSIGRLAIEGNGTTGPNSIYRSVLLRRRLTPSNATHTYSVRATVSAGTGDLGGGAGGTGNYMPGYIRITRV